jgi:hypothetical protein
VKCPDAAELAACLEIAARCLTSPYRYLSSDESQRIATALYAWHEAHAHAYEPPTLTYIGNLRDNLARVESSVPGRLPPGADPSDPASFGGFMAPKKA